MKYTAIILAGGKSKRFRQDKTLLTLGGDTLLIESIVDKCRSFADEILIISNRENKFGISGTVEVSDLFPGLGPMGGIHAGLSFMKGDRALVTACDMPFFDPVLGEKLLALSDGFDAVIPRDGDDLQPLFAVYKKTMQPLFETYIKKGVLRPVALLPEVRTRYLDRKDWVYEAEHTNRDVFYNINYQQDYVDLNKEGGFTPTTDDQKDD